MSRRRIALLTATAALGVTTLSLAACGGGAPDASPAAATEAAVASLPATPTLVVRLLPTATPTVDPKADPWFAVPDADMADVPVPISAKRVAYEPATAELDAAAEYAMDAYDDDELVEWYKVQMTAFGWGLDSEDDGSYVFLHTTDKSERFADKGLKRSATLLLSGSSDDAQWTVIVESPMTAGVAEPTPDAPDAPDADASPTP